MAVKYGRSHNDKKSNINNCYLCVCVWAKNKPDRDQKHKISSASLQAKISKEKYKKCVVCGMLYGKYFL